MMNANSNTWRERYPGRGNRSRRLNGALGLIIAIPLICIPKGGVKLSGLPITFSYLILGLVALLSPFVLNRIRISIYHVFAFVCTIPLTVLAIAKLTVLPPVSMNWAIALIVTVALIPALFLLIVAEPITVCLARHRRIVRVLVLCVALYGIADFVARNFFNRPLDVPYLTASAEDAGKVDGKHNRRGRFIKLVSTYDNGNIYGVCLLLLAPLCWASGAKRLEKSAIGISMFLTLSRTVWVGLMVWALLWLLIYKRGKLRVIALPLVPLAAITIGIVGTAILHVDQSFLLDSTLGGRADGLTIYWSAAGLTQPFDVISEMTYISVLNQLGILGLLGFCLWLWTPVVLVASRWRFVRRSPLGRAAAISLITYIIICAVDGAFLLIPVAALYWLVACVGLSSCDRALDDGRTVTARTRLTTILLEQQSVQPATLSAK